MIPHYGRVAVNSTVYVPFHTFDSNDPSASVTITGLAVTDIEIYKNGSVTQRSSDSGYTLLDTDGIDFDGVTGLHGFSIDLSDNTDAGFFSTGDFFMVAVAAITVDAATINFWACTFFIGGDGATLLTDTEAILTDSEAVIADTEAILTDSEAVLADTEASQTAESSILADTEASQTAETAILADTEAAGVPPTAAAIADQVWDELQSGHVGAGSFGEVASEVASILSDTEASQTAETAILADTEASQTAETAILADTEASQTAETAILADTEASQTSEASILSDTEASQTAETSILADSEAVLADSEAILADSEGVIADTENLDLGIIYGSAVTGTLNTTTATTDLTGYADDQLIGRIVTWTSGACDGEQTDITDYANASGTLTYTALTTSPSNGDTFKIT